MGGGEDTNGGSPKKNLSPLQVAKPAPAAVPTTDTAAAAAVLATSAVTTVVEPSASARADANVSRGEPMVPMRDQSCGTTPNRRTPSGPTAALGDGTKVEDAPLPDSESLVIVDKLSEGLLAASAVTGSSIGAADASVTAKVGTEVSALRPLTPAFSRSGDGKGQGLGLQDVMAFVHASGVDAKLYEQVQQIVQHFLQTDPNEVAELSRKLQDLKLSVEADLRSLKTQFKTMDTDQYKRERVTEGLNILRRTHCFCACPKNAAPTFMRACIDTCF
jgi:hypothetical protein